MQFSIVVPVFNEAGSVVPLLEEIRHAMRGVADYEVIYVDDGSIDDTALQLDQARRRVPALRVLRHNRRSGQSAALLSGVRAARAPWILTLDGDGQNDPADLPSLIEQLARRASDTGPCLLVGHRIVRRDNLLRRCSSRVANAVRRRVLADDTPDSGCGVRLFPRAAFLELPAFDHMHRFVPALMQRQGIAVQSVPVRHRSRRLGNSKYGVHNRLWAGLTDLAGVMWLQRRRLDQPHAPVGPLGRCADLLGVFWLRRRPCAVTCEEDL
jgi:dolichol-phosphate mannosyltransferase